MDRLPLISIVWPASANLSNGRDLGRMLVTSVDFGVEGWRGNRVARQESAKTLIARSIPFRASSNGEIWEPGNDLT